VIWDLLNLVIQTALTFAHSLFALLPQSPIYIPSSIVTDLTPIMHTAAWWFPVAGAVSFFGVYLVAVTILIGVLLIKQLIEAAIP